MDSRKRPTARERLLARFRNARPHMADAGERASFARDLRAHERELAERAAKAAADMCSKAYDAGNNNHWFYYDPAREHVRAAILKRSAAPKAHGPRAAKRGVR